MIQMDAGIHVSVYTYLCTYIHIAPDPAQTHACTHERWGLPTAHGMLHARENVRQCGSETEVSAGFMERRHMSVKARFRHVQQGPRAGLLVLRFALMKAALATRLQAAI